MNTETAPQNKYAADVFELDLPDIQGFVIRGYNTKYARHFVIEIPAGSTPNAFIAGLVDGSGSIQVNNASVYKSKPDYFFNIGFTYAGLGQLNLPTLDFNSFPSFEKGAVSRSEFVGDSGDSAPDKWEGGLNNESKVHIVATLWAEEMSVLNSQTEELKSLLSSNKLNLLSSFDANAFPDGFIHFGYKDGISQPTIAAKNAPPRPPEGAQNKMPSYMLLLVGDNDDPNDPAPYQVPADIGQNGSFSAFRILEQDVQGFEDYLQSQKGEIDPELLAAKFCGRWRNGNSLELAPDSPGTPMDINEINNFNYNQPSPQNDFDDYEGLRCPIGSHMRRNNPRDAVVSTPIDLHRVVRRAMPYGPPYDPNNKDNIKRGLVGHFVGTIENSFEFLMHNWVNSSFFAPDIDFISQDPLLGVNDPENSVINIPEKPFTAPQNVKGFPRFIQTRGSAYLFLPGIAALKFIGQQEG